MALSLTPEDLAAIQDAVQPALRAALSGFEWEVALEGPAWWTDVDVSADGQTILAAKGLGPTVLGWDHGVFLSKDGGATWTKIAQFNTAASVGVSGDGLKLLVGASGDGLYQSLNGGDTWTKVGAYTANWASCEVSTDGSLLIATQGSGVHISRDGGDTWTGPTKPGGDTGTFHICGVRSDGSLAVAGSTKRLWRTVDGGVSWAEIRPVGDVDADYDNVACVDSYGVYVSFYYDDAAHLRRGWEDADPLDWYWEPAADFGANVGGLGRMVLGDESFNLNAGLLATSRGLWAKTPGGDWVPTAVPGRNNSVYAVGMPPLGSGTMYAGPWGGHLYRLTGEVAKHALVSDYDAAKTAARQTTLDAVKVKTDLISSGEVTVRTPLLVTGELTITAGDDYVAADGTGLVFDIADPTHLMGLDQPGAEVQLRARQATWTATSVVSTAAGYTATFQPSATETAALTMGQSYQLHMRTPAGKEHSSVTRTLGVRRRVPEVE